ncbi:unannotated protein [freshwater metagenome]|uniref:Unannotated protein n=1 Tax=freshwater metagenome TaxID=449393 RepID=A0A6J6XH64_9ZZZZ
MMPALLIKMSSGPENSLAKARTESKDEVSSRRTSTDAPGIACSTLALAAQPRCSSRAVMITWAPLAANAWELARPNPLFDPVMTTVLPDRSWMALDFQVMN